MRLLPSTLCHRNSFQFWSPQMLTCVSGALLAVVNVTLQPRLGSEFFVSLVPAIVMVMTLLGGWPAAASCIGLSLLASVASGGDILVLAMTSITALACGELLRMGARPLIPGALLFGATLFAYLANNVDGVSLVESSASALVTAGLNTAAATTLLILMPRRSATFPLRCRIRWDHVVFAVTVGKLSLAIVLFVGWMYPNAAANGHHWGADPSLRICILILVGCAANLALTFRFSVIARQLPRRLWRRAQARLSESPAEMTELLIGIKRETRRLRQDAAQFARENKSAQEQIRQLTAALAEAQGKIRERESQLRKLARSHDYARSRYRALMEQTPDVSVFCDAAGSIQSASRASLRMLGFQPVELKGRPVTTLVPTECVQGHPLDVGNKTPAADTAIMTNTIIRAASGQVRDLAVVVRAFPVNGTINYLIQIRETGGMKKALATLKRARTLSRSVHRSREMFVAAMSHELRTPLHALIATLDMMRVTEHGPPELGRHLSVARISARSLLKIANDILDLTRIGSSQFTLEQRPFSAHSMLNELIAESQARADLLGLSLHSMVLDPLPNAFLGDPARLRQILSNLVSNALKFTRTGQVTLQTGFDGSQCTFDVIDTGPGIPTEKWDSIFDPFVQVDSGKGHPGGTGLGLPISRRLAEAMGGSLRVLRSSTSGSTFRVVLTLPVTNEIPAEEQSQRILVNPCGRILVVEDNPASRYVAEALLTHFECPTTIVASGEEALERLATEEFDLILMDCQMAGLDGFETTRRARTLLSRHVPIIAMTANAMDQDNRRCLEAGMDDFLPKPFGRPALHAILCKWLTRTGSRRISEDLSTQVRRLPVLDATVFDELQQSLQSRAEPLRRICASFSSAAQEALATFDGRSVIDCRGLRRHLHSLLGSAGMVGARQAEFIARKLQGDIEANRIEEAGASLELLKTALRNFDAEFRRRLPEDIAIARQA